MFGATLLLASVVALGGCDNKSDKQKQAPGFKMKVALDENHSATLGVNLPEKMPPYARVFPGANVMSVVDMTAAQMGWMVAYEVPAQPKEVLAFHKKNATDAGLKMTNETTIQGSLNYTAKKGDASLSVTIMAKDGGTFVQETYK